MLGVNFEHCNELAFKVKFKDCQLDFSSFNRLSMKKTIFKNCTLKEADFTDTDLSGSLFEQCDLHRAVFHHTTAENVDFTTSFNFSIDPEINQIKRSKFSVFGLKGLLEKYDLNIEST
ncbi:MAG: pentapeptide repeat-containing protein [Balneolaceae bacterium]